VGREGKEGMVPVLVRAVVALGMGRVGVEVLASEAPFSPVAAVSKFSDPSFYRIAHLEGRRLPQLFITIQEVEADRVWGERSLTTAVQSPWKEVSSGRMR
jgi:hypothetical protein